MGRKQEEFEASLERLSAIVEELEAGEVPLERGVALFKEGVALAKACRKRLAAAKNEVRIVRQGMAEDFDAEGPEGAEKEDGDG